jgi:hypothetical protein
MPSTIKQLALLGLGAMVGSCAPGKAAPAPVPTSHCAPLCPRDGQPPSERALWGLLGVLLGPMELFRVVGHQPIGVIEDGESAVWQALVIEVELVRDSIVGRLPGCTPQNFTTLVAWRESPERASAAGFSAWTPRLGKTEPLKGPRPSGCWFRRASVGGGHYEQFVDLFSFDYAFFADSGTIFIDRLPSPIDKPCSTPTAWPWKAPGMSCQHLTYNATMSGAVFRPLRRAPDKGPLPGPHTIQLNTMHVPGIRLTIDCRNPEASLTWMYCRT